VNRTIPYIRAGALASVGSVGLVTIVALFLGGCSMSFKLFGADEKPEPTTTASIPPADAAPLARVDSAPLVSPSGASAAPAVTEGGQAVMMPGAASIGLSPSDWLYARGALGLALTGSEDGPPVIWSNPETGSRGSFRPAAPVEAQNGVTCRKFWATRVAQDREETVEGRACQTPAGQWDVAEARPVLKTATL
jgi:surface antigen